MSVLSKDELLKVVNTLVGEGTNDETLKTIEDVTDTINSFSDNANEDWKKKYEENDASWRNKYKERFFSANKEDEEEDKKKQKEEQLSNITIEGLFKEREGQ
jgi:hypothetical protein